jgi:plastocyanin
MFLAVLAALLLPILSHAYESKVVAEYLKAADARDAIGMNAIIEENIGRIPSEIKALLYESQMPRTSEEDKQANYYIAELLAKSMFDITGDSALLIEVKQAVFNARLSPQIRSKLKNGVHIIEFPPAGDNHQNVFEPDNIEISTGQTVRWVNKDDKAHIFASMSIIGEGGIFTPNIEEGDHWDYTFYTPGDYYYICFIHKGMIGKITVVDGPGSAPTASTAPAKSTAAPAKTPPAKKSVAPAAPKAVELEPKTEIKEAAPVAPKKKRRAPEPEEEEDPFGF